MTVGWKSGAELEVNDCINTLLLKMSELLPCNDEVVGERNLSTAQARRPSDLSANGE